MGLLDDAIREHLELKRRRGADPGEVAREQHEALMPDAPDVPDSLDVPDSIGDAAAPVAADTALDAAPRTRVTDAAAIDDAQPASAAEDAYDTRETAELDMRGVLDAGEQASGVSSAADSA